MKKSFAKILAVVTAATDIVPVNEMGAGEDPGTKAMSRCCAGFSGCCIFEHVTKFIGSIEVV